MWKTFNTFCLVSVILLATAPRSSQGKAPAPIPPQTRPEKEPQPAASAALAGSAADPFSRLVRVTPIAKLPPLASVRLDDRDKGEEQAERKRIRVLITSRPNGATVSWGGRVLGKTPLTLSAMEGSTPADLVVRRRGYMILRTRVQRRISRTYFFKLHPAKFR